MALAKENPLSTNEQPPRQECSPWMELYSLDEGSAQWEAKIAFADFECGIAEVFLGGSAQPPETWA